jgi:protein-S-isoprenylcysteine O-methyltransferase Ste14
VLILRALAAFVALPGVIAYAVPLTLARAALAGPYAHGAGAALVLAGTLLLLACVREFYVAGRGTLAPWSPPEQLVSSGPYRYSRNPMYVGVATILAGWAVLFASRPLALYALGVVVAFQLRVLLFEEPWAAREFGAAWQDYRARVPRWFL